MFRDICVDKQQMEMLAQEAKKHSYRSNLQGQRISTHWAPTTSARKIVFNILGSIQEILSDVFENDGYYVVGVQDIVGEMNAHQGWHQDCLATGHLNIAIDTSERPLKTNIWLCNSDDVEHYCRRHNVINGKRNQTVTAPGKWHTVETNAVVFDPSLWHRGQPVNTSGHRIFIFMSRFSSVINKTLIESQVCLQPWPIFPNYIVMTLFGKNRKYLDGAVSLIHKLNEISAIHSILITIYPDVPEQIRNEITSMSNVLVCKIFPIAISDQKSEVFATQRVFTMFNALQNNGRYIPVDVDKADHDSCLAWVKKAILVPPGVENTIHYRPLGPNRIMYNNKRIRADLCYTYLDVCDVVSIRVAFLDVCNMFLEDILKPTITHGSAEYRHGYCTDETLLTYLIECEQIKCHIIEDVRRSKRKKYTYD